MGFEDVNIWEMMKDMFFALPCFLMSLALWYFVLKKRDKTPFIKKNKVKIIKEEFKKGKKNGISYLKEHIKRLKPVFTPKKWMFIGITFILYTVLSLISGTFSGYKNALVLIIFMIFIYIIGLIKTEDFENLMLVTAIGMISFRHSHLISDINIFYPFGTFIIATILFVPSEIKASYLEKKEKLFKSGNIIRHREIGHYISTGFFITSILYFLTSF